MPLVNPLSRTRILIILAGLLVVVITTALMGYASVDGSASNTGLNMNDSSSLSTLPINSSVLPPPQPQGVVNVGVTPNQLAAGGPLPGNHSLALEEAECVAKQNNPPWYHTLQAAELRDSNRTKLYACAQFPGSFTGPNQVYAYASPTQYYTPNLMATRGVNDLYVLGGGWGSAVPKPSGQYVAKINPGDLTQLWRTELTNLNATTSSTGVWNYIGGINVLADGNLAVVANSNLFKLNGTTGAVEGAIALPTGKSLPENTNYNGLAAWPDGTLVMKSLNRAPGCSLDGGLPFSIPCPGQSNSPNSVMVAVDPKTWKVLDWIELEQNAASRPVAENYNGKNYAYFSGTSILYRYLWDGKNITLDNTWGPVQLSGPNQTGISAPVIGGNWVFAMTNNVPADVPMSLVAVSQSNSSEVSRINPIPLQPGEKSFIPSNAPIDPENHMVYAMDAGAGKLAGIKYDPKNGNMSLVWTANQSTLSWWSVIGPVDKRVTLASNMYPNTTMAQMSNNPPPSYTEQIQWRDAATGKLLAASDFFQAMSLGAQPIPGYGGIVYDMIYDGHIMALQVLPQANNTTSTAAATTSPSPNSTSTTSGADG